MKKSKKILGLLLCLCMVIMLVPAAVFAAEDTFTVTYMTNAGVEMEPWNMQWEIPIMRFRQADSVRFFRNLLQRRGKRADCICLTT